MTDRADNARKAYGNIAPHITLILYLSSYHRRRRTGLYNCFATATRRLLRHDPIAIISLIA